MWKGLSSAPFAMLLIESERETLWCDTRLPIGFIAGPRDAVTGCATATRARSNLDAGLLAAFPLFGAPLTIVMGTPQATDRTRAQWLRTILHEHFHQWQAAAPDYFARVAALDLAGDDSTGMWMLNYPFPYAHPPVSAAHDAASRSLASALAMRGRKNYPMAVRAYLRKRRAFAARVAAKDWRYAEFQMWQEGVARWTEQELGKKSQDAAVVASARALEHATLEALASPDLAKSGRTFAYYMGAGEAMLLEACGPAWRAQYEQVLATGPLLDHAARRCKA